MIRRAFGSKSFITSLRRFSMTLALQQNFQTSRYIALAIKIEKQRVHAKSIFARFYLHRWCRAIDFRLQLSSIGSSDQTIGFGEGNFSLLDSRSAIGIIDRAGSRMQSIVDQETRLHPRYERS